MLVNWNLINTDKPQARKKDKLKSSSSARDKKKLFADEINDALQVSKSAELFDSDFFMENLADFENNLIDHPNRENFFEYKDYIKMVADKILQNAYKKILMKDTKKRQFEVIKVIDENLNNLFQLIMQKSTNKQKISLIMGNIKGLILDLNV